MAPIAAAPKLSTTATKLIKDCSSLHPGYSWAAPGCLGCSWLPWAAPGCPGLFRRLPPPRRPPKTYLVVEGSQETGAKPLEKKCGFISKPQWIKRRFLLRPRQTNQEQQPNVSSTTPGCPWAAPGCSWLPGLLLLPWAAPGCPGLLHRFTPPAPPFATIRTTHFSNGDAFDTN